jgi:hypothetical protein
MDFLSSKFDTASEKDLSNSLSSENGLSKISSIIDLLTGNLLIFSPPF